LHDGDTGSAGGKSVRFSPNLPYAGSYQVYARWTADSNRATNVPIDVNYANGTTTFSVNQQTNNGVWVLLGAFSFNAGTNGSVLIRNDQANGYVIADAVRFVPMAVPPVLAAIANQTILAGQTLLVTNSVTDPNTPPLALAWSLSAPARAAINSTNGLITWRPAIAQSGTTSLVSVVVCGNSNAGLSATQQFKVAVAAPSQPRFQTAALGNGMFQVLVSGDAGPDYSLLASTNLVNWQVILTTNSPALPVFLSTPATSNYNHRFYRVKLGP
jgi:hypothetical protein